MDSRANSQYKAWNSLAVPGPQRDATGRRPGVLLAQVLKRCFDAACAAILLVLLLPVFMMVAALVATDGGPILFRHRRVGRGGRTFDCLKFRTMIVDAQDTLSEYLALHPEAAEEWQRDQKLAFDPRITAMGKALRNSSLDELPQLINVLKGEMSLVGPRPVTEGELARYGADVAFYKSVRPGITGLWQVSGRNAVSYERRVALDVEYVRDWHLLKDIRILLMTPKAVMGRDGAR